MEALGNVAEGGFDAFAAGHDLPAAPEPEGKPGPEGQDDALNGQELFSRDRADAEAAQPVRHLGAFVGIAAHDQAADLGQELRHRGERHAELQGHAGADPHASLDHFIHDGIACRHHEGADRADGQAIYDHGRIGEFTAGHGQRKEQRRGCRQQVQDDEQALAVCAFGHHTADEQEDDRRGRQRHIGKAQRQTVHMEVFAAGNQVGEQDHLQAEGHEPAELDHQIGRQFDLHAAAQLAGTPMVRGRQQGCASTDRFADPADGGRDILGRIFGHLVDEVVHLV